MGIQIHAQLRRAEDYVLAVHAAGEGFVFHLLLDAGHLNVGDGFRRFDQRAGSQKACQLIAGEERLGEVGDPGYPGVLGVTEDGGAQLLWPALLFQCAYPDKGMFFAAGVTLVIEVMEQGSGGVKIYQTLPFLPVQLQAIGLGLTVGHDAGFHSEGMLAQAVALGPFLEQLQGLWARIGRGGAHFFSVLHNLVRVTLGFSEYYGGNLGVTLSFYLTIMVHSPQSSTYNGAKKHRGSLALALREQLMATTLVSLDSREVVRCEHCALVQYRTSNSLCRRCHKPLDIEEPVVLGPQPVPSPSQQPVAEAGLQVAAQVRDIRRARHLSQRQLASRMQVPRTYISKIENGKAIPTLGSLERIADALEIDVSQLVRDRRSRRDEEVASILADPFLAEIASLLPKLDSLQRTLFYGAVRDKASGQRRTA